MIPIQTKPTLSKNRDYTINPLEESPLQTPQAEENLTPASSPWNEGPVSLENQIVTAKIMLQLNFSGGSTAAKSQPEDPKNLKSTLRSLEGFADGFNPVGPLNEWIQESLNLTPPHQSDPSYKTGHEKGVRFKENILKASHLVLDIGGMIPGVGEPLDLINGGLYAVSGDYTNAGLSMAAIIPLGGVFASGGRLIKKVDTMGLTPSGIAEILEKTTVQAEKVGRAIRDKSIKVNILGNPLFDKAMQKFGVDPEVDRVVALAHGEHIYVNRDSASFFGDIVHEGTHALDYLNDYGGNVYQWEKKAFYHDQQFQKWVDGKLEFKDMNDMVKTIYELY